MASTGSVVAQSMAMILAPFPPFQFSLAQADITAVYMGFGQAQAHMVKFAKQTGKAQAQADVNATSMVSAQAEAYVTI